MERRGHIRPIQGGGTGTGFQTPRQITRVEPIRFTKMSRDMLSMAYRNISNATTECDDGAGEERGDNSHNKMLVWTRELEERLFILRQRKVTYQRTVGIGQGLGRSIDTPPTTCGLPGTLGLSNSAEVARNSGDVSEFVNTGDGTQANSIISTEQGTHLRRDGSGAWNRAQHATLVKFIPALPKTVEEVVKLWRKGSESDGYSPVRLFEKAEMRKALVRNYTNNLWAKGGQKSSFYRIKDIVVFVSEFGPVTIRIEEEGSEESWNSALRAFHSE